MSLERRLLRHQARSFPRVSGDEPHLTNPVTLTLEVFPA